MPDFNACFAKFFRADDLKATSRTLTIKSALIEEISTGEGKPKENKPVVRFVEDDRGVVLNKSRNEALVETFGTDSWDGKKVELYFDPNIKFGGKRVGGIGIKAAV
jgi:hypothetical protein